MEQQNNPNNPGQQEPKTPLGPDRETLHTTDPQEHMEGPLSSLMHKIEHQGEKSDHEDPVPRDSAQEEH
ncbi:MAG: hypothetical protein EOO11_08775, partial [Chitinophagaceae bacterium]